MINNVLIYVITIYVLFVILLNVSNDDSSAQGLEKPLSLQLVDVECKATFDQNFVIVDNKIYYT